MPQWFSLGKLIHFYYILKGIILIFLTYKEENFHMRDTGIRKKLAQHRVLYEMRSRCYNTSGMVMFPVSVISELTYLNMFYSQIQMSTRYNLKLTWKEEFQLRNWVGQQIAVCTLLWSIDLVKVVVGLFSPLHAISVIGSLAWGIKKSNKSYVCVPQIFKIIFCLQMSTSWDLSLLINIC